MKSHLVGFGCSWIHGDEIDHPTASPGTKEHRVYRESNCFLGQLGAQLGMTVENYGISGSSLQSTLWEFARWAQSCEDTSRYLVVIGLTDDARTSWWNGPNPRVQFLMHNPLNLRPLPVAALRSPSFTAVPLSQTRANHSTGHAGTV